MKTIEDVYSLYPQLRNCSNLMEGLRVIRDGEPKQKPSGIPKIEPFPTAEEIEKYQRDVIEYEKRRKHWKEEGYPEFEKLKKEYDMFGLFKAWILDFAGASGFTEEQREFLWNQATNGRIANSHIETFINIYKLVEFYNKFRRFE